MATVSNQKEARAVRNLPFCYLCGARFLPGDVLDHDHVPPEAVFAKRDRQPLKLRAHRACNGSQSPTDEKFGQLIGLRRGQAVAPRNQRLEVYVSKRGDSAALFNFNVDKAIWRWIQGFHAALYREPLPRDAKGTIVSPFPRADRKGEGYAIAALLPQHEKFVETIKTSRAQGNVDSIHCNNNQLRYECVWGPADNRPNTWFCVFALDVAGWKDLGRTTFTRARGCAGTYIVSAPSPPRGASVHRPSKIIIPNYDPLDPFAP